MSAASHPAAEPAPAAPFTVAALYQFRAVPDPAALRARLLTVGREAGLCGTLIVAGEGLNGTVAGTRAGIDVLRGALLAEGFDRLEYKESAAASPPFRRFKVRLKREIVTMGVPVEPTSRVGQYVAPEDWNALISAPDVVVIDTRNRYEVKAGTFRGAVDPGIESFREFPAWLDAHEAELRGRRVAMFCTGGIRCEKSTSLLRERGFEDVFHLRGGILQYLEDVPQERSEWDGECFVFDGRVTVGHGLREGAAVMCHSCGWPLGASERQHPLFEEGVSCEHCHARTTPEQKAAFRERQRHYDQQL
ncbi:rhodanese-related sulfurtransferase [Deinococcus taeanensis]|uniref:oxygen-dependent tRNA uridine(34) hydroxylase TrhO n=1 Tax=Deinococcus taeanensis TaxID=2737050 RepID=UPI001CDC8447|nr:rhodanese-related sulfurtransferase [Deinococcus taeanensis]UBV41619.1 rhodanese-related sulfurtransferase [Deinococcus taeanensis]